jgi:hypothetical protein
VPYFTAESTVRYQCKQCGICGEERYIGTGVFPNTLVSPLSITPPMFHCYSLQTRRQTVGPFEAMPETWENSGIVPYILTWTSHYMYVSGQLHVPAAIWPGLTPVHAAGEAGKAHTRYSSCAEEKGVLHLLWTKGVLHLLWTKHLFLCSLTRCLVTTELSRPPSYTIRSINLKCMRGRRHPGYRKETSSTQSISAGTY